MPGGLSNAIKRGRLDTPVNHFAVRGDTSQTTCLRDQYRAYPNLTPTPGQVAPPNHR